jgi:hypothetical protein
MKLGGESSAGALGGYRADSRTLRLANSGQGLPSPLRQCSILKDNVGD